MQGPPSAGPGQPGTPPPAGAGPGSPPPIGSSPATGPTQNLGQTAQANKIAMALAQGCLLLMAKSPPGSDLSKVAGRFRTELEKVIGAEGGAQDHSDTFKQMAMNSMRMAPQRAAMATAAGPRPGIAGIGGAGGMTPGQPPSPPPPA